MRSICLVLLVTLIPSIAWSQSALSNCADQFIDGNVENAPRVSTAAQGQPFSNNEHLCFRDDEASFFAIEYWPDHFAPRWAAYRLSPDNYGKNGCETLSRKKANCYVKADTWEDYQSCTSKSDPFHPDHMLSGAKLGPNDFASTGHDRGHIAPRQAFSGNVCGTYQTFSMANMSPQRGLLNQRIWQKLEKQVLTWGFDEGPIYVATGTTFTRYPHERFEVYSDGGLDPTKIYGIDATMSSAVAQHHANHVAHDGSGHILEPGRDANPAKVKAKVEDMRMPTGYFKVIYRPAVGGEQAHAIGFLLPHTYENLNMLSDFYSNLTTAQAFWVFVSQIEVIEEVAGMKFPGISNDLKAQWGDDFFFSRDTAEDLPRVECGARTAQGILANSTKEERLAACTDMLD